MKVTDVGDILSKATLRTGPISGAVPHMLAKSLIGYLGGRYVAPMFLPDDDPERARRLGIAGAVLGAGTSIPDLWGSFSAAQGVQYNPETNAVESGPISRGFKGLFNGYTGAQTSEEEAAERAKVKLGSFWDTPTLPVDGLSSTIANAAYNGQIDPVSAMQLTEAALSKDKPALTPGELGAQAARAAVKAGLGGTLGYVVGRAAGAVGGAIGLLGETGQAYTPAAGALVGLLGNLFATSGGSDGKH